MDKSENTTHFTLVYTAVCLLEEIYDLMASASLEVDDKDLVKLKYWCEIVAEE